MDTLVSKIDVIAEPMTKFANIPFIASLSEGMMASVGITFVGSIFMVVWLFCADGNITAQALLPFMKPWAGDLLLVNQLTMGIMSLYMVIAIGNCYAKRKDIDPMTGSLASMLAFILLNYNAIGSLAETAADGTVTAGASALSIAYWGGAGVITAILSVALAINVLDFCFRKNIRIKMPEMVPPAISRTFSAILPYFFITLIAWFVRTIMNIDVPTVIGSVLSPIVGAADNAGVFTAAAFLKSLLWACGIHGDNIVDSVTNAFTYGWLAENNAAALAGQPLPHVWTPNIQRIFMWTSSCWPILFYMFRSGKKLPHLKSLATMSAPSAIFSIVEPIMFGLPVVLNPFLLIPFVLSHTVTALITYLGTAAGLVGAQYISLPWAVPAPLLGYLSAGGSIGGFLVVIVNFLVGLVIFYPFWKAYEKSELEKYSQENEA
ncbi:MAG: PTS transporter subunit EIIC [Solobacterium sp.]|nr:PTS transporter subunit EIIC [Solobacterium sp.]